MPTVSWRLDELLGLHHAIPADATQRVGLLRALWQDDYFDRDGDDWRPRTPAAVQQMDAAADRAAERKARQDELATWLRRVADGGAVEPRPAEADGAVVLLEKAAVQQETPESAALMQAAHLHGAGSAFDLLVRLGHWTADENRELHRLGVPDVFPEHVLDSVREIDMEAIAASWSGRRRWGGGTYAAADGARAYRLRRSLRHRAVIDIHLAAPMLWVTEADAIDGEALERGTAVHLIEREIPLLPPMIQQASRLTPAASRPALTLTVCLDEDLNPRFVEVKTSRVRPRARLDDESCADATALQRLAELAMGLHQCRRAAGAWQDLRPTPWIELRDGHCRPKPETPAAQIDKELSLLAAEAIGDWCQARDVPAIYRSHGAAADEVPEADVAASAADREALRSFLLDGRAPHPTHGITLGRHAGLGLRQYAVGADPAASYLDLVMQRQLLAVTAGEKSLPAATLERAVLDTQTAHEAAQRVAASSQRYWCLKWLEQFNCDEGVSCVVVEPRGPGYLVLLEGGPEAALAWASRGERIDVAAGQRLRLRIEQVSARRNVLRLIDPRPEV